MFQTGSSWLNVTQVSSLANTIRLDTQELDTGFKPIGNLSTYKFTGVSKNDEVDASVEDCALSLSPNQDTTAGSDWALVRVQPSLFLTNHYIIPGENSIISITGHHRVDELSAGEVWICAGVSGTVRGFLNGIEGSVLIGSSLLNIRSIVLDRQLSMHHPLYLPEQ
jgi:hypothetical protein